MDQATAGVGAYQKRRESDHVIHGHGKCKGLKRRKSIELSGAASLSQISRGGFVHVDDEDARRIVKTVLWSNALKTATIRDGGKDSVIAVACGRDFSRELRNGHKEEESCEESLSLRGAGGKDEQTL